MTDRAGWLTERRQGIGGSDVASLFNLGYGCQRRLWYDKRNTPEDYPREENLAMELGSFLEPFFASKYEKQTGRAVSVHDRPFIHPSVPELRVNVDRMTTRHVTIQRDEDDLGSRNAAYWERGVLEIKSQGRAMFYKSKREGLIEDYILQLQHGMLVTGAQWGSFAIGSRDSGELLHWDHDRDETICKEILIAGPMFWATVQNGPIPDALEPDDKRCSRCAWRKTCHGNALAEVSDGDIQQASELVPLVTEYLERKELMAQAEALVDETGEQLRTELGDRQAVYAGEKKIYFRPQAGKTLYKSKELLEAYRKARAYMQSLLGTMTNEEAAAALGSADYPEMPAPDTFVDKAKPSRPLRIF